MSRLNRLYRDARARFDADPDFAGRARKRVVAPQAGDADTMTAWQDIVAESKRYFEAVYTARAGMAPWQGTPGVRTLDEQLAACGLVPD